MLVHRHSEYAQNQIYTPERLKQQLYLWTMSIGGWVNIKKPTYHNPDDRLLEGLLVIFDSDCLVHARLDFFQILPPLLRRHPLQESFPRGNDPFPLRELRKLQFIPLNFFDHLLHIQLRLDAFHLGLGKFSGRHGTL